MEKKHDSNCVVCSGKVVEKCSFKRPIDDPNLSEKDRLVLKRIPWPSASEEGWISEGYFYCEKCGLQYEFPPPKVID